MKEQPVQVNADVLKGIEAATENGAVNMFDRYEVRLWLHENGHFHAAMWIGDFPNTYAWGLAFGFEAESA